HQRYSRAMRFEVWRGPPQVKRTRRGLMPAPAPAKPAPPLLGRLCRAYGSCRPEPVEERQSGGERLALVVREGAQPLGEDGRARGDQLLDDLRAGRRERDVDDAPVHRIVAPLDPASLLEARDEHG